VVEHLPRFDLLRQQSQRVVAQLANLRTQLDITEFQHVELHDVGQLHQRRQARVMLEIVERNAVAALAQTPYALQQFGSHADILEHFDDQMPWIYRGRVDDQVAGEIDEYRFAVGDFQDAFATESGQ
jgi:hypothetical protein